MAVHYVRLQVQFCLGSKPKAMVMVDQLFYKGLYDSLEKLNVLSFLERIPELVVDTDSMREMSVFFGTTFHLISGPLNDILSQNSPGIREIILPGG